jgi:aarF domain-containing kinase
MRAVWQDEKDRFRKGALASGSFLGSTWCVESSTLTTHLIATTCRAFATGYYKITFIELMMDCQASLVKVSAWLRGFYSRGLSGAHDAAAGLY